MKWPTHLEIDRAKWLRGEGAENSRLLRHYDGKMCCLGLYLEACGVPREVLRDKNTPAQLDERIPRWLYEPNKALTRVVSMATSKLMGVNDDPKERKREDLVREMFAAHGVTVTFTGAKRSPRDSTQKKGA